MCMHQSNKIYLNWKFATIVLLFDKVQMQDKPIVRLLYILTNKRALYIKWVHCKWFARQHLLFGSFHFEMPPKFVWATTIVTLKPFPAKQTS